jgi:hypothetical protein
VFSEANRVATGRLRVDYIKHCSNVEVASREFLRRVHVKDSS